MSNTVYSDLSEINELQTKVMKFIYLWVHEKRTPVPLKEVIANMVSEGVNKDSAIYSLKILVKKGYIRRAYTISNKTSFVMLRSI